MRLNTTAHHSPEYGSVQYVSERDTSTYVRTYVTVETRRDCGRKVFVHNTQAERHVVKVAHLSIIVEGLPCSSISNGKYIF